MVDIKKSGHMIPTLQTVTEAELIEDFKEDENEQVDALDGAEPEQVPLPTGVGLSQHSLAQTGLLFDKTGKPIKASEATDIVIPTLKLLKQVKVSDGARQFAQAHAWATFEKNKLFTLF